MAVHSKRSHEGYLMIDHRASPGLPADLSRKLGMDPAQTGEGKLMETASLTCSHCKVAVLKNPLRTKERAYCRKCDHYICDFCAMAAQHPDYVHNPFSRTIDLAAPLGSPPKLLLP